jgi:hypothetical protein
MQSLTKCSENVQGVNHFALPASAHLRDNGAPNQLIRGGEITK